MATETVRCLQKQVVMSPEAVVEPTLRCQRGKDLDLLRLALKSNEK
jgi:hypothetical protein